MREWERKHPKLFKEIKAGKYAYLFPESIARPAAAPALPKPTRPGDIPLRATATAVLPEVGGLIRKVPVGLLRVGVPASWGLFAASMVPPSWVEGGKRVLSSLPNTLPSAPGMPGGSIVRGKAPGYGQKTSVPGRKLPVAPPPAGRRPDPKPQPVGSSPSGASAAPGNPRPATAGPPKPATVTLPAAKPRWWEVALGALAKLPPGMLLPKKDPSARARTIVNIGPFASAPQPSAPIPQPEPLPDPLTPLEPGGADCSCKPKKPRKPRQPRDECRSGRFIERVSGLQKYSTRKVPCRQFNARLR